MPNQISTAEKNQRPSTQASSNSPDLASSNESTSARPSIGFATLEQTDSPAVEASPRDLNLGSKSPKLRRGGKGEGDPTGLDDGAALLALLAALLGLALVLADDRDTGQPLRHLFFFGRRRGEGSEEEGVVEPKA